MKHYNHAAIEEKYRTLWEKELLYTPDMTAAKRPYYNLMMFPYPSAEGLHVGNMYAFTGADVHGRFRRQQGFDVFEPIGLDGFGIHSENYAIKVGKHPAEQAKVSQENFYRQLNMIGNSFAWDHRLETYDPEYYRWTQWLFAEMFRHGLAYQAAAMVNWCPHCKTVLADEQVEDGKCERCKTEVVRREMTSWYLKITAYADRLLDNIDNYEWTDVHGEKHIGLDWPKKVTTAQKNWIGRSSGLDIDFSVAGHEGMTLTVWTKFWETVFGVTYLVLAPEHAAVLEITTPEQKAVVEAYIETSKNKSDQERKANKEKTGIFTGAYAINPVNGQQVPIWVADYVLADVGTGAVMGVPAHDERDFEFATVFELPVIRVVAPPEKVYRSYIMGGKDITEADLEAIGAQVTAQKSEGWMVEFADDQVEAYEKLITEKLQPGFWNEYVGPEIVFLFKHSDGTIERLILTPDTTDRINELAGEFNQNTETRAPWKWLASVSEYAEFVIHERGGTLENSGQFDGQEAWGAGKEAMKTWMVEQGFARLRTDYHLRDWLISRQRYWGPPIPMVFSQEAADQGIGEVDGLPGWFAAADEDLPVILPHIDDYKPEGDGTSPLDNAPEDWKEVEIRHPRFTGTGVRETNVSDTFLDSAWYFLRYPALLRQDAESAPFGQVHEQPSWFPVDAYIGGAEHAVLHLLYARFITMVLYDWGLVPEEEPFPFLFGHGLIIKDGAKMSKSRGNVVNPDEYIEKYGADALRTYLMFLGPYDQGGDFRDSGMHAMYKWLARVWETVQSVNAEDTTSAEIEAQLHRTILANTDEMAQMKYNTCIARIMELVNTWRDGATVSVADTISFLQLLAPFAPYMTEALYQQIRQDAPGKVSDTYQTFASIHTSGWPEADATKAQEQSVVIAVQVNGKLRDTFTVQSDQANDKLLLEAKARELPAIQRYLSEGKLKKTIAIPGKIVNFVVA